MFEYSEMNDLTSLCESKHSQTQRSAEAATLSLKILDCRAFHCLDETFVAVEIAWAESKLVHDSHNTAFLTGTDINFSTGSMNITNTWYPFCAR